jgi:hypothetical protein
MNTAQIDTACLNRGNRMILRETGDAENDPEGGYDSIYEVLRCKVNEETGTLEYETRGFPTIPNFTGVEPSVEYLKSIPRPGRISRRHVRTMKTIIQPEVSELLDRGVRIKILPRLLQFPRR